MGKRLLVIDDEENILDAIKIILEEMGHSVDTCQDPFEGERKALNTAYDLIITDLRMPGKNGAEIAKTILSQKKDARLLVITAYANDTLASEALKAGALGLVRKPFEISKILAFLTD